MAVIRDFEGKIEEIVWNRTLTNAFFFPGGLNVLQQGWVLQSEEKLVD